MDSTVINYLNNHHGGSDAVEVTTYRVYVNNREITITITDGGPFSSHRFHAEAYPSDLPIEDRHMGNPSYSLGNSADTVTEAIDNVHWWLFDNLDA